MYICVDIYIYIYVCKPQSSRNEVIQLYITCLPYDLDSVQRISAISSKIGFSYIKFKMLQSFPYFPDGSTASRP